MTTSETRIRELEEQNARLRAELAAVKRDNQGELFGGPEDFTHTFPFVWASLKNRVKIERRGHRSTLVKVPEVKQATEQIRNELYLALRRDHRLPLFGTDEVARHLVWDPVAETITVTWRSLGGASGSRAQKVGRARDLVNLAALLDDAVGRERVGRHIIPGSELIYRDDSQIAVATESRTT